jgi:hypothetical protein
MSHFQKKHKVISFTLRMQVNNGGIITAMPLLLPASLYQGTSAEVPVQSLGDTQQETNDSQVTLIWSET